VPIMVRQQRAQSVRAFTPPAAVQFGALVFAFAGTNALTTRRLREEMTCGSWVPTPGAAGFKWRSGVCALRPAAALCRRSDRMKPGECPLLAQSGHGNRAQRCLLLGVKRTSTRRCEMSAYDPKRRSVLTLACDLGNSLNPENFIIVARPEWALGRGKAHGAATLH